MENLMNALLITVLVIDLVYICVALFREINFQRAIKKKIKEVEIEIQKLEDEDKQ